jgi:hypothetical protein
MHVHSEGMDAPTVVPALINDYLTGYLVALAVVAALAEREEIERDKLAGELLERSEVELAFKAVGAQIRSLMETYPDQVAPLVAPVATLEDCHALLSEQCRNVLSNFSAAMQRQSEALQKGGAP